MQRLLPTLLLFVASAAPATAPAGAQTTLRYDVDLADTVHHVFVVALRVPPLTAANDVFEFAATAPGAYQTMNIGRFVHDFTALDAAGAPIATEHIGTNEWRAGQSGARPAHHLSRHRDARHDGGRGPHLPDVRDITRRRLRAHQWPRGVRFSPWDATVPLTIHLSYPSRWTTGTPLTERGGDFVAASYDRLVDSPILLGAHLTGPHSTSRASGHDRRACHAQRHPSHPTAGRDALHAHGRGRIPREAAGGPLHLPSMISGRRSR